MLLKDQVTGRVDGHYGQGVLELESFAKRVRASYTRFAQLGATDVSVNIYQAGQGNLVADLEGSIT